MRDYPAIYSSYLFQDKKCSKIGRKIHRSAILCPIFEITLDWNQYFTTFSLFIIANLSPYVNMYHKNNDTELVFYLRYTTVV